MPRPRHKPRTPAAPRADDSAPLQGDAAPQARAPEPEAPAPAPAPDTAEQPTRLIEPFERERASGATAPGRPPGQDPDAVVMGTGLIARQPPPEPGDAVAVLKVCPHCATEYETEARFCPRDGAALRPKGGTDPLVGTTLADRYHMLKTVGEGGMGRVYLAEHVRMNRQCAVKVMRSSLVHDADAAARFGREASSAARILHPNVAAVFDFGEADGLVYLVMEYVDGEPLGAILAREQRIAPERAMDIARQVADGLAAAHELGIVHRDLKPDNIIITRARSGREIPKVVDFGIAKAVAEGPSETLTRSGFVIGTPEFMSPEQLLGDPVDARSDIYSLGCILYLMLLGVPAADAPTREAMLKRRLREAPTPPSELDPSLPQALDVVVARMLATSPDDRFASAAELRDALDGILGQRPITGEGVAASAGWTDQTGERAAPSTGERALAGGSGSASAAPASPGTPTGSRMTPGRRAGLLGVAAGIVAIVVIVALLNRDGDASTARPSAPGTGASATALGSTTAAIGPATDTGAARPSVAGRTPGATTPTPRPAPTPPRSDSARPRPDTQRTRPVDPARRRVVAAAERYASAISARDMARVQSAYPGISDRERERLQQMFAQSERISAQVSAGAFRQEGSTATLDFTLRLTIFDQGSRDEVKSNLSYQAVLGEEGGRWVIRELRLR